MTYIVDSSRQPRTHLWSWISGVCIVIIGIAVGILLYWSFASENILIVKNAPFPSRTIDNGTDRYVLLDTQYCKNTNVTGKLRMSFVSKSKEVFLPIVEERLPKGCKDTTVPIPIPKDLQSDTYKIKFRVTYDINPLKKNVISEFESKDFKI